MAHGSFEISGSEVYDALTQYDSKYSSTRVLNDYGESLADLIAERVLAKLAGRLGRKEEDEP